MQIENRELIRLSSTTLSDLTLAQVGHIKLCDITIRLGKPAFIIWRLIPQQFNAFRNEFKRFSSLNLLYNNIDSRCGQPTVQNCASVRYFSKPLSGRTVIERRKAFSAKVLSPAWAKMPPTSFNKLASSVILITFLRARTRKTNHVIENHDFLEHAFCSSLFWHLLISSECAKKEVIFSIFSLFLLILPKIEIVSASI